MERRLTNLLPRTARLKQPEASVPSESAASRLECIVRENYSVIWRLSRRWGLSPADADDVAQHSVVIASRRLDAIAYGSERAFLCRTALFLASKVRRSQRRRAEFGVADWESVAGRDPDPECLLEERRARAQLDAILDELPASLRAVFVLLELELLTQEEVAEVLQLPRGTVASQLRRARELVANAIERRASHQRIGAKR